MSIREQLNKCWLFADTYQWGILASASELNDVQISIIFFARHNDAFLFTLPEGWRHLQNIERGRVFSFLISNAEIDAQHPERYIRLFIQGKMTTYPPSSREHEKFLTRYQERIPHDPKVALYIGVLKPAFISYIPYDKPDERIEIYFA